MARFLILAGGRVEGTSSPRRPPEGGLLADPFDAFAAGVAERLAGASPGAASKPLRRRQRARWVRAVPLALAASLAVGVAISLVSRPASPPGSREVALRVKGAPALTLWLDGPGGARLLEPGEPVPVGSALRLALPASAHAHAAVVLVDEDGPSPFYGGPVVKGPLPSAFEWTGAGKATVVAVLSGQPVDPATLARLLARGESPVEAAAEAAGPGAQVVTRELARPGS